MKQGGKINQVKILTTACTLSFTQKEHSLACAEVGKKKRENQEFYYREKKTKEE